MALTRAQLLMGNSTQGSILSGQVQGVTSGPGLTIDPNGSIQINSQTVIGLMKLGQTPVSAAAAYNGYTWPTTAGSIGQQLATNGSGTLSWSDPDGLAWTAKGEIVVGTGVDTQTFLTVGPNGSILIADNTQVSGLAYTSNYVPTAGATTAAFLPAGTTGNRPSLTSGQAGAIRYNASTTSMELWNGTAWETIASDALTGFVPQTSPTGSAVMPAGATGSRDASPASGYTRFNTTTASLEFWNGTSWNTLPSSSTNGFVQETSAVGSAILPSGTDGQRDSSPAPGYTRYNSTIGNLEFWNGSAWVTAGGGGGTGTVTSVQVSGGTTGLTYSGGPVTNSGTITLAGVLGVANGGTGATSSANALAALLPPQTGQGGKFLQTNGATVSWTAEAGSGTVTSVNVSGGSTGLTFSGGPITAAGNLTMAGTLAVANGGTGATTTIAAINALLPSQSGQGGNQLGTDGTNVSWVASGIEIPSGTAMLFAQTAAPVGWVKVTTYNDATLRVVSGTAGNGGSVAFSTVFSSAVTVPLPQHAHGINDPGHSHGVSDPGHSHSYTDFFSSSSGFGYDVGTIRPNPSGAGTGASGTGISINGSGTGISVQNSGTAGASLNFDVTYVDVIIATKS